MNGDVEFASAAAGMNGGPILEIVYADDPYETDSCSTAVGVVSAFRGYFLASRNRGCPKFVPAARRPRRVPRSNHERSQPSIGVRRGVVRDGVSVDVRPCAGAAGSGRAGCGRPRRPRDREGRGGPGGQGGGPGRGAFIPEPVPPPQNFATSTEHYQFLFRLHKGGTRHTYESVPKREGLWTAAGNTSTTTLRQGWRRRSWCDLGDYPRRAHAGV